MPENTKIMFPKIFFGTNRMIFINCILHNPEVTKGEQLSKPVYLEVMDAQSKKIHSKLIKRIRGFFQCSETRMSKDNNYGSFFIKKTVFNHDYEFREFAEELGAKINIWVAEIKCDLISKQL